ncbi:MAG: class I SAM-dependent methyltransferase [Phycisphaerae bacterium]|nr:class I SAM-dependent methyltransferase [Phycisphaerae bacterium]
MTANEIRAYDVDEHVAEVYDQFEAQTDDVELIRRLIRGRGRLRILEPFCGTGRILIPLAMDGHEIVGLDRAEAMLGRAREKLRRLGRDVQNCVSLERVDVIASRWPSGFDLVLLGGNCLYELATPGEQEGCIASAAAALRRGGHLYVDNNHMEGDLDEAWRRPGVRRALFPRGTCTDGARVEATSETFWWDAPGRLVRIRRSVTVALSSGSEISKQWVEQTHPVSTAEVTSWLQEHGFLIENVFGSRAGDPYEPTSPRAIFWARRQGEEK